MGSSFREHGSSLGSNRVANLALDPEEAELQAAVSDTLRELKLTEVERHDTSTDPHGTALSEFDDGEDGTWEQAQFVPSEAGSTLDANGNVTRWSSVESKSGSEGDSESENESEKWKRK